MVLLLRHARERWREQHVRGADADA
eukprot:SAG11_NODE_31132_length_294_cov_1.066667_2_plen_24_part_01